MLSYINHPCYVIFPIRSSTLLAYTGYINGRQNSGEFFLACFVFCFSICISMTES